MFAKSKFHMLIENTYRPKTAGKYMDNNRKELTMTILTKQQRNPYIKRPVFTFWAMAAVVGWFMAIVALTVGAWLLRLVWG